MNIIIIGKPWILRRAGPDNTIQYEVRWRDCTTVRQESTFQSEKEALAFCEEIKRGKHSYLDIYGEGALHGDY